MWYAQTLHGEMCLSALKPIVRCNQKQTGNSRALMDGLAVMHSGESGCLCGGDYDGTVSKKSAISPEVYISSH